MINFMNFKIISDTFNRKNQISNDYKVTCLINKLPLSWSAFAEDLRHKKGDIILIQAQKVIHIEDQHRENFKIKSEMKAKVNLVEDKPKYKFMNPKGKKFKKPNHFHSSPHTNSSFFKPFQSSSFKPKIFGQKFDGRFCYVCERTNHLASKCFNQKKELVKAQPRENRENGGHKVNMVKLNSNSFRLYSSLPIVNSITFFSDWWLDSGANIHIYTDSSCLNPTNDNMKKAWAWQMTPPER